MRLYLASGFSVMNVKGRERELLLRFRYSRLFSFADCSLTSNKAEESMKVLIDYNKGGSDENIPSK